MTILSCGPGQRRRHLPFLLSLPLHGVVGDGSPHSRMAALIGCNLLGGGGGLHLAWAVGPSKYSQPSTLLGVWGGQDGPQATRGQGMRGNLPGVPSPSGSCVSTPRNTHPARTRTTSCQVLEKKESLFQIPNQITARYAHSWPGGDFLSLLQWHLIFFFL